jgi:hypothetical protein
MTGLSDGDVDLEILKILWSDFAAERAEEHEVGLTISQIMEELKQRGLTRTKADLQRHHLNRLMENQPPRPPLILSRKARTGGEESWRQAIHLSAGLGQHHHVAIYCSYACDHLGN